MKKRFLGALLIGLLFMIGGCASNAKKPEKYDYLMEWEFGVRNSVRISFGKDNTEEDVRYAARLLRAEVEKQRAL